jgi:TRAP-type C4-dicarboxylate transport system substrate-binding protein
LIVLALVVGIPTFALAQDADKSKTLRLSVAVGPAFALGKVADAWAKLISERSGGAIAVDLHPGATLAQRDPEREFIALRDGAADLAVGSTLHWSAQVSELAVVGLPWLAPEQKDLEALTTGATGERLRAAIGRAGAVPLALAPLGHRAIAIQSKPVRVPEDLRTLRIRITPTPFLVEFYAGFGALPLALPFTEAVDLFRNAGLDAQEGSVASFAATRLDSLGFRHVTLWNGVGELAVFAVNPAAWDAWTADRRELVRNAAEDASKQLAAMVATEQDAALAALKARGINPLRLTATGRASFAAAARPTYDRWAAVAGEDIVRAAEGAVAAAAATRQ